MSIKSDARSVDHLEMFHTMQKELDEQSIRAHEKITYSQDGSDGVVEYLMSLITPTNMKYIEFGVWDGMMCESRFLREKGWSGFTMDGGNENKKINLEKELFYPSNIVELLNRYS